jgi:hypothetical protein
MEKEISISENFIKILDYGRNGTRIGWIENLSAGCFGLMVY